MMSTDLKLASLSINSQNNSFYTKCKCDDETSCDLCQTTKWLSDTIKWIRTSQINSQSEFAIWLASILPLPILNRILTILPQTIHKENLPNLFNYSKMNSNSFLLTDKLLPDQFRQCKRQKLDSRISEWLTSASYNIKLQFTFSLLRELESKTLLTFIKHAKSAFISLTSLNGDLTNTNEANLYLFSKNRRPNSATNSLKFKRKCYKRSLSLPVKTLDSLQDKRQLKLHLQEFALIRSNIQLEIHEHSSNDMTSFDNTDTFVPGTDPTSIDFIRHLPVHLSKYILHFLPSRCIAKSRLVSIHWHSLGDEVLRERLIQLNLREHISINQESIPQIANIKHHSSNSFSLRNGNSINSPLCTINKKKFPTLDKHNLDPRTNYIEANGKYTFDGAFSLLSVKFPPGLNGTILSYDMDNLIAIGGNKYGKVHFLDTQAHTVAHIPAHGGIVKSLLLTNVPLGDCIEHVLITGSYDLSIRMWSIKNKRYLKIFNGHKKSIICLDAKNGLLLSGSTDRTARLWEITSSKCIVTFKHLFAVTCVKIANDKYITGTKGGEIYAWDHRTHQLLRKLIEHGAEITCTGLDSTFILSGSKDCLVKQWFANKPVCKSYRTYSHPNPISSLTFLCNRLITGTGDGKVRIWNMSDGSCVRILPGSPSLDPILWLFVQNNTFLVISRTCLTVITFEDDSVCSIVSELQSDSGQESL